MATRPTPTVEPNDWQTVSEPNDWQDTAQPDVPALKPAHPIDYNKLSTAMITSHMTGVPTSLAYEQHDTVKDEFARRGVSAPIPATIANDFIVGVQGSIPGLIKRNAMPDVLAHPDKIDDFVKSLGQMIGDLPVYAATISAGTAAGSEIPVAGNIVGGGIGFAIPAMMREALVQGIQNGKVTSFGDLMSRVTDLAKEGGKGFLTGAAFGLAGKATVPLGTALGPASAPAEATLKLAQQVAALEVTGSLLEGHMPTAEGFAKNAALVGALELVFHAVPMAAGKSKQALMDRYAKDGTMPEETATKLQAQPPVKPDMPDGLQPAIELTAKDGSTQVINGEHDTHADLAEAKTGTKPVTIDELNAKPELADKVLERPETHEQSVIDRAYEIASENVQELPPKSDFKSGQGFTTPSGDYMTPDAAKSWVKENEPEVHETWLRAGSDNREFRMSDYKDARERAAAMNIATGENAYSAMTPENAKRIAAFREDLNPAKAGVSDKKYADTLRTFIIGQKDMRTAIANNLRRDIIKELPDTTDRQALTFMRDYKGNEQGLQTMLDAIKSGDKATLQARLAELKSADPDFEGQVDDASVERMQKLVPVIEKALAPTPKMQAVDSKITQYAQATFDEAKALDIFDSSIPPENYITHILREADAEEQSGGLGRPKLATKTPYGMHRGYPTTIDAMIAGKVPRTLDAADEIAIYGDRHAIAAATRLFATELKNSELGKWGTQSNVPSDWQRLGAGRLFEYHGVDADGKPFTTALYVPKKIAEALTPITERKTLFQTGYGKKFRDIQSRIKAGITGLSIFHGNALTHSAINNMGTDIVKLLDNGMKTPEFQRMTESAAADGLITARSRTPYEVYKGLEGVSAFAAPERMDVVRNIYGIKQLNELSAKATHLTFDVVQTKYKVTDFHIQVDAWMAKHPEATDQELFAARRSIAKEVNAVYGGLNWEAMGWGPNHVELLRAIMLAPDWSFSNVYSLKYAMPKFLGGEGGPGSSAARMFWFRSTVNGLLLTQATSLMLTGQLSKNPTQVYLGKDDKGNEMYTSLYFAGAPKDFVTQLNAWHRDGAVIGTAEFLSYKLAPLVGTGFKLASNRDWSGKPIIKKSQGALEKTGRGALFAGIDVAPVPFGAKTAEQLLMDPNKNYTYKDFILGLAGSPVYHAASEDTGSGLKKSALSSGGRKSALKKGK